MVPALAEWLLGLGDEEFAAGANLEHRRLLVQNERITLLSGAVIDDDSRAFVRHDPDVHRQCFACGIDGIRVGISDPVPGGGCRSLLSAGLRLGFAFALGGGGWLFLLVGGKACHGIAGARCGGFFRGEGGFGSVLRRGVERVLHGRGPAVVFGFPTVGIDVLIVVHEDASRRRIFPGLMITAVATGETLAVDPVAAVKVGIVKETHRREEMLIVAFLRASLIGEVTGHRADVHAGAVLGDLLRAEVGPPAVAAEDVVECDGHLQCLVTVLQIPTRFGIAIIIVLLHFNGTGAGVETVEPKPTVQEAGATRHETDEIVLHQQAAVNGPDAFELFKGEVAELGGGGLEAPDQCAITFAQAVHVAVHAAEENATFPDRRRGVDATTRREVPVLGTGFGVE